MKLSELWNTYFETHVMVHVQESTQVLYAGLWHTHVSPQLGNYTLNKLCKNPIILDRWVAERISSGVGDEALRKSIKILSSVFSAGVRWRLCESNPTKGLKRPSGKRKRVVDAPTVERVWEIVEALEAADEKLLVGLCGFLGLRPGEARALDWSDIGESSVRVWRACKGDVVAGTKTGVERVVPLSGDFLDLVGLLGGRGVGRVIEWSAARYKSWSRVFVSEFGLRPYDLRHGFASRLVYAGVPLPVAASWLGHSQLVMLSTYSHVFGEVSADTYFKAVQSDSKRILA